MEYIQIITTCDDKLVLEKIAELLIEEHLAACCQIIGDVESWYFWEGKLEQSSEYICYIKTKKDLYNEVERLIKQHHSYKVPEVIAINIDNGNMDYLKWIDAQCI